MKLVNLGSNMTELELTDGVTLFFSYNTPVAAFVPGQGVLRTTEFFSRTTTRHINKWIDGRLGRGVTVTPVGQEKIQEFLAP